MKRLFMKVMNDDMSPAENEKVVHEGDERRYEARAI